MNKGKLLNLLLILFFVSLAVDVVVFMRTDPLTKYVPMIPYVSITVILGIASGIVDRLVYERK